MKRLAASKDPDRCKKCENFEVLLQHFDTTLGQNRNNESLVRQEFAKLKVTGIPREYLNKKGFPCPNCH
jgi:hypothetical protein